jgi:hypothetical protein
MPMPIGMSKEEATQLLVEALDRVRRPTKNYYGGDWQSGGCYWRLMKVLYEYVMPSLANEKTHMFELFERFGMPVEFHRLNDDSKEKIAAGVELHHAYMSSKQK